jgi:hypothetical protein
MAKREKRSTAGTGGSRGPGDSVSLDAEDLKYDSGEWLVPASNEKGQSERLTFRCPPVITKAIEQILYYRRFPYTTPAELIRHALLRHLAYLHRQEPSIPRHYLTLLQAATEAVKEDLFRAETEKTFTILRSRIDEHLSLGRDSEARKVASYVWSKLEHTEDSAWREIFRTKFKREYGWLMDVGGKRPE